MTSALQSLVITESEAQVERTLVQISKAHSEDDEICLSIVQEPGVHIRVSLTPQNFADTLCTGRKVEAKTRKRFGHPLWYWSGKRRTVRLLEN